MDWTGGQIGRRNQLQSNEHRKIDKTSGNNDSADDVRNVDLTKIHYLSGPFEVETAQPGDVLLVEIMVRIGDIDSMKYEGY